MYCCNANSCHVSLLAFVLSGVGLQSECASEPSGGPDPDADAVRFRFRGRAGGRHPASVERPRRAKLLRPQEGIPAVRLRQIVSPSHTTDIHSTPSVRQVC